MIPFSRRNILIFLSLLAMGLLTWNIIFLEKKNPAVPINAGEPTYVSETSRTLVYAPEGNLNYILVSKWVSYFSADETSWFEAPVLTVNDKSATAIWSVYADKAKLTKDHVLYLYGHVTAESLTKEAELRKISTQNAQVNLSTLDVTSQDEVTLCGRGFNSSGLKMRGNLRTEIVTLIDQVKTHYKQQVSNDSIRECYEN